jgi:hypothetical protein
MQTNSLTFLPAGFRLGESHVPVSPRFHRWMVEMPRLSIIRSEYIFKIRKSYVNPAKFCYVQDPRQPTLVPK